MKRVGLRSALTSPVGKASPQRFGVQNAPPPNFPSSCTPKPKLLAHLRNEHRHMGREPDPAVRCSVLNLCDAFIANEMQRMSAGLASRPLQKGGTAINTSVLPPLRDPRGPFWKEQDATGKAAHAIRANRRQSLDRQSDGNAGAAGLAVAPFIVSSCGSFEAVLRVQHPHATTTELACMLAIAQPVLAEATAKHRLMRELGWDRGSKPPSAMPTRFDPLAFPTHSVPDARPVGFAPPAWRPTVAQQSHPKPMLLGTGSMLMSRTSTRPLAPAGRPTRLGDDRGKHQLIGSFS